MLEPQLAILQPPGLEGERGRIRKRFFENWEVRTWTLLLPSGEQDGACQRESDLSPGMTRELQSAPHIMASSISARLFPHPLHSPHTDAPCHTPTPSAQNVLPSLPWEGPFLEQGTAHM